MDLPISFYEKVIKEYEELENKLNEFNSKNVKVKEAYNILKGHNLRYFDMYFDYNSASFCVTICNSLNLGLFASDLLELYKDEQLYDYKTISEIRSFVQDKTIPLEKKIQGAAERVSTEPFNKGNINQLQK